MIEIAAAVCLIADPARCREISLTYEPDAISVFVCAMYGQSELAKWSRGHPEWRVTRWRCGDAGQVAKL